MPDDYFEDGPTEMPPPDETPEAPPPGEEKSSDQTTALLPKSVLAGKTFKPGDEVVLKVTHVYEDEVAVEYASEPSPEKPATDDEEIDAMAADKE